MSEATITLDSRDEAILLFGSRDQYLREIRTGLGMQQLVGRGDQLILKGSDEQLSQADRVFTQLRHLLRQQGSLSAEDVKTVLEVVTQNGERLKTRFAYQVEVPIVEPVYLLIKYEGEATSSGG